MFCCQLHSESLRHARQYLGSFSTSVRRPVGLVCVELVDGLPHIGQLSDLAELDGLVGH